MNPSLLLAALLAALLMYGPAHAHGDTKQCTGGRRVAAQTAWGIAGKPAGGQAHHYARHDRRHVSLPTPSAFRKARPGALRRQEHGPASMLHVWSSAPPDELARHAAMMARFPGMEHDEPYMVHVDPGKTGEIV